MIIDGPDSVTKAVLSEIEHAPNPRFREVMTALVKHLHAFVREAKLTEEEFHQACAVINAIGQKSNAFHNEAVLMSGSLGVSTLVCLLNNGNNGATETTANLLGPLIINSVSRVGRQIVLAESGYPTRAALVGA